MAEELTQQEWEGKFAQALLAQCPTAQESFARMSEGLKVHMTCGMHCLSCINFVLPSELEGKWAEAWCNHAAAVTADL